MVFFFVFRFFFFFLFYFVFLRGGGGGIKNLNKYFLCILSVYSDSPCEKGGGGGGNVFFLPLVDPDLGSGRDLRSSKEASKWV